MGGAHRDIMREWLLECVRSGYVRVWEVMGDLCVRPSVTPSTDLAPVPSLLCEIILCAFFHANRRVIKSNLVMCHTIYIL